MPKLPRPSHGIGSSSVSDHLLEITYKVQRADALDRSVGMDLPDAMGDASGRMDPQSVVVMDGGLTAGTTYFYQVQATLTDSGDWRRSE